MARFCREESTLEIIAGLSSASATLAPEGRIRKPELLQVLTLLQTAGDQGHAAGVHACVVEAELFQLCSVPANYGGDRACLGDAQMCKWKAETPRNDQVSDGCASLVRKFAFTIFTMLFCQGQGTIKWCY